MNFKFIIFIISIVIAIVLIEIIGPGLGNNSNQFNNFNLEQTSSNKIELTDETSLFKITTNPNEFLIIDGIKQWYNLNFDLFEDNQEIYESIFYNSTKQNTIVIYPSFTATAYDDNGFYDFYKDECNETCLTVSITDEIKPEMGANGLKILNLLGYKFIRDIDVEKNPDILNNYDKVILLHNEYVTQNEFDAITSHPKVIYVYPNALYAKVEMNHETNEITLIRGHGYPEPQIANGFDWEFENTDYEYDLDCLNWEFYEIDNGWMLNCYPDRIFFRDAKFLEMIKDF